MDDLDLDFDDDDVWSAKPSRSDAVASFVQEYQRPIFVVVVVLLMVAVASGAALFLSGVQEAEQADAPAPMPEQPFSMGSRTPLVDGVVSLPAGGVLSNEVQIIESPIPDPLPANTVAVADLDVVASIVTTDIVDNELVIPDDVRQVARYSGGAKPGDATGTVLLAGHVNSRKMGRGALYPLYRIKAGTIITVADENGVPHRYGVVGLITTGKDTLPDDLFSTEGQPRLVLVTCGGPLERTASGDNSYRDNVIVTALPLPLEDQVAPAPGRTAEQPPEAAEN